MRAVVQRASRASVTVAGDVLASFDGPGLVALVGVTHDDGAEQVAAIARKIAELRLFAAPADGSSGVGELSALDIGAHIIVVSQFTLYADTKKGRRPSWNGAAPGSVAEPLVDAVVADLRGRGLSVGTGRFGADMQVELVNDGPVTIILDA
ncbi:D-tyrosyl-tRNA(Tyr) deacylase [Sanguibacter gelidistatuariae]|uniref:D-aminoacyl-tRNA deacylase n=1 Tax=Sanguibacter gelidistatuariae TaxID=1814289 RepID=A0A1G6UCM2_9MICO|nr:D-aminoacyl-tRNA deacylase [Sanguibacter gelidistatuariae]SDD39162.1 D-tyrosyl-tRNA(Tyr) deacylase [Sanguibacter gelidistatuariae]